MAEAPVCTSFARLRPIQGLPRRIRRALRQLMGTPREELPADAGWLVDHAVFLLEEARRTERELRRAPRLPACAGAPRIALLAREIVAAGEGEVTAALTLRTARTFFAQAEPLQAELGCLPAALSLTLLEAIDQALRWCSPRGQTDQAGQREAALRAGQAASALRALHRLPFDRIIERLNPVAAALREEATYRRMDGAGRRCYQQRVERLAKKYAVAESAVARAALHLAKEREGAAGEAGYYLLERPDRIGEYLLHRPSRAVNKHRTLLFLAPLYGGAVLCAAAAALCGAPIWLLPGIALCLSEPIRRGYFFLTRRFAPSRPLPRIYMKRLTRDTRTLVAVPALLTSPRQAVALARQLSVLQHANPDPYLDFLLLGDYADSREETQPEDDDIVSAAREAIRALNGTAGGHFLYLHRLRQWNGESYAARERKRGALNMLNLLLTGGRAADPLRFSSCDPAFFHGRYRYVITLDADTFLPPGAARRLVGAMEHPLQKGRVGVIQPRMQTLPAAVKTHAQRLFGGAGGADVYGFAQQDLYQDLWGRGSFVGKGIYQPEIWMERLAGRLPDRVLLSHDLIEGETVRSALASDIVLYEGHPRTLAGWIKRLHRWTRGDWQLLPFLTDRRLDILSRHKIWDNLRRSLLPAAQVTLLLYGAAGHPFFLLLGLPWPLRGLPVRLLILPGKMWTLLDAAARALWRRFFSRRRLLEWTAAAQADGDQPPLPCMLAQAGFGALLTALSLLPGGLWPGALGGMLWLSGPLWTRWANRPRRLSPPMTEKQKRALRALARDTWRFFEDAVGPATRFLPPDNVQTDPPLGQALRTSPTNIGLYLLSCCAAREMGFLSPRETAERIADTLNAMEALQTWKGHFYNWYDLENGAPLPPRFISTVDSGNLAGCLFACAQYCRQRLAEMPAEFISLPARLEALFARMDFTALYDRKRDLFFVGFDEEKQKPAAAHYDMLASEARLTSFLAVMTGQAPLRHWRRLNRAVTRAGGGPALLSWGGTLFEYLMPHLLLPLIPDTLLGEGCRSAVRAQMADRPGRPFGVSESGYYAFDADLNYQYRAFGLPSLALSTETAGAVIAPYASALALPFFPRSCAANLERMRRLGWADAHGLFEAADYAAGSPPRLVRSHMAHHQGMILCALCNALENGALIRSFMAAPAARAYAFLLQEPAPGLPRRRAAAPRPRRGASAPGPCARTPRRSFPSDAAILSSGHISWVLSARGQGYLAWKDVLITRFFPDAGVPSGPQLYVYSRRTGAMCRPMAEGAPRFESGRVRFKAEWEGMHIRISCCCAPLSQAAVLLFSVENAGKEEKTVEAVTYLEIALSTLPDDQAHPNYRDLSVQVLPWGKQGLIARRLPRDEKEKTPLVCHFAVGDHSALCRQGDRRLFLGRSGSYETPEQLRAPMAACAFRTGDVLAPCLSLRAALTVKPGEKKAVHFVTACREKTGGLTDEMLSVQKWRDAFSLAYAQDQMTLRSLRMDEKALQMYQQALGAVLFTGQPHQGAYAAEPRRGLWRLGVSGTLPAWLAVFRQADEALLRHALRCHLWMRQQGVRTDLILLCPEENAYHRPVWDAVSAVLTAGASRTLIGVPGGITLARGGEDVCREAAGACRLTLRSGIPLGDQLAVLTYPPAGTGIRCAEAQPLLPRRWESENGFGGFTPEGDYLVARPCPAPWHNLLCGERFGTLTCETGILQSYAGSSRLGGVTRRCPDVHRGVASEKVYLRDETGLLYPLTGPAAVHSPGVTEYRRLCGGIASTLTVFAHSRQAAGIRALTLRSGQETRVTVYWAVRFAVGESEERTRCRVKNGVALAENGEGQGLAWAALAGGRCRILPSALPESAMLTDDLSGGGSTAVFSREIVLPARGQEKICLLLGAAPDEAAALAACRSLTGEDAGSMEREVRSLWQERLGRLSLFAGDPALERLLNRWLPYQTIAARLFARMGPYQVSGAWGFRDQLQDLLCLLHTDPAYARRHILLCAAHQYPEGDVQHWWHEERHGVRTRISDDRLFLPLIAARYVKITGDESILTERTPYLLSAPLAPEEKDRYEEPAATDFQEPLLDHCLRAVESVRFGAHGLPLMMGGDWNDGMNRVGGESVWLGFFLAIVLREFSPLCPPDIREKYQAKRRSILDKAESAWTGKWYLRAWYSDGRPLGGPDTQPPRIDLISQAFSVLAGAPRLHARAALMQAMRLLYDREAGLVRLLDPPFTPEEKAGYIGAYLPGVRENGGQYTHAVPWLILALIKTGAYEWAWEIARTALPDRHADTPEKANVYQVEPYVLAGDVYAGENRGRGGWTWYTGSAAWMYFVWVTALLGFEKRGDRARLTPCPGGGLDEFTLVYRFGSARYHFTAARDAVFPTLDGEKLSDGWAALTDDGKVHEARFPLKE